MRSSRVLKIAIACTLAASANVALAQTAANDDSVTELETVIVTGTYIRGTAEDAALPVDVISSRDLELQGSPSMTDLMKSIPSMQGVIGESNQFGVSQAAGTGNANLRGLGAARTLVLLNGRRVANSPAVGVTTDINLLPIGAIGRVEVLKDGAAATYGSDAIGGVVNFITKENVNGLELDASFSAIEGSDGDYDANVLWGLQTDSHSLLLSAGYRHRSMLSTLERDWALQPRANSPEGGWSGFSNPGTFTALSGTGQPIPPPGPGQLSPGTIIDPACSVLGGTTTPTCAFQYTAFDNLVEEENHYNVFAQYRWDIADAFKIRAEALWAMHDVPEEHASPSYGPNQGPSGGDPNYFIPFNSATPATSNPGLTALFPYLTPQQQATIDASRVSGVLPGIIVSGLQWRPFATGGNPTTGGALENSRKFDGFRASLGFEGDAGNLFTWDVGATYGENGSEITTPDILVARLGAALRGLGGPNCTGSVPGQNGCEWFNPFSTAIASNVATGQSNSVTYTPGTENSAALANWLQTPNSYETSTTLLVVDAVLDGKLGFLSMPGGEAGWAFGLQYRDTSYELTVTDPFADATLYPCAALVTNPAAVCPAAPAFGTARGALSFYNAIAPVDVSQNVIAGFLELSFPILESLSAQVAVRYEDYGNPVGSTTNPKLSVRYQPFEALTLRGSYGSTFRAPPQTTLAGSSTFLFFTPQASGFKPVDTVGNPNLKAETADTFNVGMIVKAGGFMVSADYWNFKFEDALTTEVGTQLVTALYTDYTDAGGVLQQDHCNDPDFAALLTRFTFTSAGCRNPLYNPASTLPQSGPAAEAATLLRTRVNQINAQSTTEVSGIDFSISYAFDHTGGGEVIIGGDGTYYLEYKLGANYVEGILIDPETDAVGTRGGRAGSQPEWRGTAYVNYGINDHNLRVTARYISGMEEKYRPATFATNTNGIEVFDFLTFDVVYRISLPSELDLTLSAINVTDEDPPFARLDLNYDPFVGNPLGRYFKLGVGKKF